MKELKFINITAINSFLKMKLIAENQLIGTHGGFAVFRNLYEKANGERVSVRTSKEFEIQKERTLPSGKLVEYPPESEIFNRHKL